MRTRIQENILRLAISNNNEPLVYYKFGESYKKDHLYIKNEEAIYTFDLRKEIPDSIKKGNITHAFNISRMILPNRDFTSYHKKCIVRFGKGTVKDTTYLKFTEEDDAFTIGDHYTPLYKNIKVILKPQKEIQNKNKTSVYLFNGKYHSYIGGTWLGNNIEFNTRKFGKFVLKKDVTKPTVRLVSKTSNQLKLKIKDNLSGITNYRATLNGKYLVMSFRYQTGIITSVKRTKDQKLKGDFKLEVTDNEGNTKIYTLQL